MRIVIAAWHLKDFNVGLGRYSRGLIEALGRVDSENQYEILLPDDSYTFPERSNVRYHLIRFPLFKRRVWEQVAPRLVGEYDLLHCPYDSTIRQKRGKFVVTIHDVKPLLFPSLKKSLNVNRLVEQWWVGDRWKWIDHVMTPSEHSKQDIVRFLKLDPQRVSVVYPGINGAWFAPAPDRSSSRWREKAYLLTVAGNDPTKNVETLLHAYALLPESIRTTVDLVLAGDMSERDDLRGLARLLGIEAHTVFTGRIKDDELVALYQGARLFVFPSLYEGFGFPVLEAMACGCPVLTSNVSSLPEVAGEAAILLDPMDQKEWARQMEHVLSDSMVQMKMRECGLEQAKRFTWDATAKETIKVYEQVVEQSCASL
jgi:glycosyltransferase involved in cell wall biosynthesis